MARQPKVYVAAWLAVLALIVFSATALRAHVGDMPGWEVHIFQDIYDLPSWLTPLMLTISWTANTWVVPIAGLGVFIHRRARWALEILLVGLSSVVFTEVLKHLVNRPRPPALLAHVWTRDYFARGPGFPSGHTSMVTAVGLVIVPYVPRRWRWLVYIWIVGVAFSRLYLAAHAPLDVIGGFCLGLMIAYGFSLFQPQLDHLLKKLQ